MIDYQRYYQYLEEVKYVLDEEVYKFASNSDHFDLRSPNSLHEAWLEEFKITEDRIKNFSSGYVSGAVTLLGPAHDRKIILEYTDVQGYNFSFDSKALVLNNIFQHGDIYTHELRLDEGVHVHEILFARGHRFLIKFGGFSYREELLI
jgi:hypothetical protein